MQHIAIPEAGTDALPITLRLCRDRDGGFPLTEEALSPSDFADICDEFWLNRFLRHGQADVGMNDLTIRVRPVSAVDAVDRYTGLVLEGELTASEVRKSTFSVYAFSLAASRASKRLFDEGSLKTGDNYFYELALPKHEVATSRECVWPVTVPSAPDAPVCASLSIRKLMDHATSLDELHASDAVPVFFTRESYDAAERFSRRGAKENPPVESGAILIGSPCACPDTGEFFIIVFECLEVRDSEEKTFSLGLTSRSWTRIHAVMKQRQKFPATQTHCIVGQAHGHNFLPGNGKTCAACQQRERCDFDNVFTSEDDRIWMRCVFVHTPWQLCGIFGLTARGDNVAGMFGLIDGRLQRRSFYLVDELDRETKGTLGLLN